MRAYSDDLRLRIIEMIQLNEESQAAIAEHFSVSLPFVEKLWHRFRTTGKYQAKPFAGGVKRLLKDDEQLLRGLVTEQSDLTLAELCERVSKATGKAAVTTATVCVELQRLKLPLKKSRFTLVREKVSGCSTDAPSMTAK
ncbi:MAG: transposase [Acidobacteriota bacterium]|nr:transposase [Acidobacteriota bacterium]